MATVVSKPFGVTRSGESVTQYILSSPSGFSVTVLDYGCIIKDIVVPAKNGPVDVVLGHDTIQEYEDDTDTYFGAFVGRYANRIKDAQFTPNGKTYPLEANNGKNHLHGKGRQRQKEGLHRYGNSAEGNIPQANGYYRHGLLPQVEQK